MSTIAPDQQKSLVPSALDRVAEKQDSFANRATEAAQPDAAVDESPRHRFGRVISATGLQVLVLLDTGEADDSPALPKIGTNVVLETTTADLVASVSAMSSPTPDIESGENEVLIAELELVGEITDKSGARSFERGIGAYPVLGDLVAMPTAIDLALVYGTNNKRNVRVGFISGADGILATLDSEKLQQGNFAILGKPGQRKILCRG